MSLKKKSGKFSISFNNYYSQLTGLSDNALVIKDNKKKQLRTFVLSYENIMKNGGNGFIFEGTSNNNDFLLDSRVAIIRFNKENTLKELIQAQSVHVHFDTIWEEISQKLTELKYETTVSADLINTILNTQNITQEFINLIGKMSSSKKSSGKLNIPGIRDYKKIMYNLSHLISEKLDISVAFYNHFVSNILSGEAKPVIMSDSLKTKLVMIYTKFSTEKICIYSDDKCNGNASNIVQFVDINTLSGGERTINKNVDLFQLGDGELIKKFIDTYVDNKIQLSSTQSTKELLSEIQPMSLLPEFIQFNPMDALKKLPSININRKDYLLGFPKDNGCRNLYTTIETGIEINGEVKIDNKSGSSNANVWWCE